MLSKRCYHTSKAKIGWSSSPPITAVSRHGTADRRSRSARHGSCATSPSTKSIWAAATTATPKSEPTARANRQCAGANFRARVCYMKKRARRIQRRRFEKPIFEPPRICIDQFVIDNIKCLSKEQFDKRNHGVLRGKPKTASMKIRAQFAMQTRAD